MKIGSLVNQSKSLLRLGGAVVGMMALTAAAAQAASFAFETEGANSIVSPWKVTADKTASGGRFVEQPLHTGRPPKVHCACTFKLKVPTAGRYHIWGRAKWPNGCANSVDVKVDKLKEATLGQDGTYMRWHWVEVKGAAVNLSRGVHTFQMLNREDGPTMDEFYFTTDEDEVPAAIEHPTAGILVK